MADSFKDQSHVVLQSGDANVAYAFKFRPCSGSTTNDGAIPYGSTLAGSSVAGYDEQGRDVSTTLVVARSLSSNIVTVYLTHSSTFVSGTYKLTFNNTYSLSGSTRIMSKEADYRRVLVGDF